MNSISLKHALIDLASDSVVYLSTMSDAKAVQEEASRLGYKTEITVIALNDKDYMYKVELVGSSH